MSNRYARFWQRVAALATPENPDVQLTTFLYWNYLPAPTADIDVPDNVYGEFVPWGQNEITYFPLEQPAYEWLREQWREWERTGITMAYRPNHYHGGYVLPYISTRQAGDFFQFGADHGMVGFDFDSIIGHWATKGPMFYVQFRLFENPEADIGELREEYFSAFGSAADAVEDYFGFWERHSESHTGKRDIVDACEHLSVETFAEAEAYLETAEAEAANADSIVQDRVAFLRNGLEHARLCWEFVTAMEDGAVPPAGTQARERAESALERLREYRREHESPHIADFLYAAEYEFKYTEVESLLSDPSTP